MADTTQIKEHMAVIASDGQTVGLVDHLQGSDMIKLTRQSGGHGHHHLIPTAWVDRVDTHATPEKADVA